MNTNNAKAEILARWEDILKQITSPAKQKVNGHTSYICPLCGHGSHGDGLAVNPKSKDGKGLKCFGSCDFSGDIIDLIGEVEHIESYPEKLKRAGELIGISIDDYTPTKEVAQNQPKTKQSKPDKDTYIAYYKECASHLEETNYLEKRGISEDVAKRFLLGYDTQFKLGTANWKALIIPTGRYSFVARNTSPLADDNNRYRNRGESLPFNTKALQTATKPIFIVEGELDALSIIEVGGEAVGLGSTSNIRKLVDKYLRDQKPAQPLVLALDNDTAGEKATEELESKLEELDISYYRLNVAGQYKDPNKALIEDREAFTKAVKQAEHIEEEALEAEKEAYKKTSAFTHLVEFINGIDGKADTPATPTGFTNIDKVLDGGLYEGLYIIGAITSLGKTTLALQIADQIAQSGQDVLIFSLEMARTELMSKSISRHTLLNVLRDQKDTKLAKTNRGITTSARWKNYSQEEIDIIIGACENYSEYAEHIYIHEGLGDIGTEEVKEAVSKHIRLTGNRPVVLVDYVQILAPYNVRATDKQNTDKAVLELKRISRDFKIPVIGISSFNRASYREEVTLEAFKESGSLEYGSDVLIGLQLRGAGTKDFDSTEAKKKDPREIELVILKNRNGRTGDKIELDYYPLFNYFRES